MGTISQTPSTFLSNDLLADRTDCGGARRLRLWSSAREDGR